MKTTSNDKETLIVFAKAPLPGDVKTRLIPFLSPQEACELYQCFVKDIIRSMRQVKEAFLQVAYQPHAKAPDPSWVSPGLVHFRQEGQSLGERLFRAFSAAFQDHAKRVVIIGSDSPTLPPGSVRQAFRALRDCDVVLGPAPDGGYYLVGMSRLCPGLFDQVVWSGEEVFEKTLANVRAGGYSLKTLPPHPDIDTPEDLEAVWRFRDAHRLEETAPLTHRYLNRLLTRRRPALSA